MTKRSRSVPDDVRQRLVVHVEWKREVSMIEKLITKRNPGFEKWELRTAETFPLFSCAESAYNFHSFQVWFEKRFSSTEYRKRVIKSVFFFYVLMRRRWSICTAAFDVETRERDKEFRGIEKHLCSRIANGRTSLIQSCKTALSKVAFAKVEDANEPGPTSRSLHLRLSIEKITYIVISRILTQRSMFHKTGSPWSFQSDTRFNGKFEESRWIRISRRSLSQLTVGSSGWDSFRLRRYR